MMMDAVCTFETSVYFNETKHSYIPEACLLHSLHCLLVINKDIQTDV
jgi:hypothetical protein